MNNIIKYLYEKINSRKILIIAGNYQQFKLFCDETLADYEQHNNLDFEGVEFTYYNEINSIRGCRFDDLIKFGTWWDRDDVNWDIIRFSCMSNQWLSDNYGVKYEN